MATTKPTVTWMGDSARAKIVALAGKRALTVANMLARAIKKNINKAGPPSSSPGEYPRKRTGQLHRGIRVIKRNQYRVDVVSEAPHAGIVEQTRPYFQRTIVESRSALERAAKRG